LEAMVRSRHLLSIRPSGNLVRLEGRGGAVGVVEHHAGVGAAGIFHCGVRALPLDIDPSAAWMRQASGGMGQGSGLKPEMEMRRTEIEAGVQSEQVAGELPGWAAAPLVAMAPARVEDLEPGRAAVGQHETAPAVAELSENKIHAPVFDKERHYVVREIRCNQAGIETGGVIVAGSGRIIWKTILQMLASISNSFLRQGTGGEDRGAPTHGAAIHSEGPSESNKGCMEFHHAFFSDTLPRRSRQFLARIRHFFRRGGGPEGVFHASESRTQRPWLARLKVLKSRKRGGLCIFTA
jgi:hypothetical protein